MSFYFLFLAGVLLVSAVLVVTLRNIFHCALFLILALLSLALIYFRLGAPFVGVMQLVVYVGAIMILILFAIMLTSRLSHRLQRASNQQVIPAALAVLFFLYFALTVLRRTSFPRNFGGHFDPLLDLGKALLTAYLLPFEVISLILLVALVGAIVLARRD
ncbi:NADH-quinone oxidoreductase subunit J [Candidatus Saganbacteria bacterium]|uniref:NADH-quinone oxidoreductase subunit J n=1 Tax=Candidatus Saganbacteria bacterium TaxID=2575572 RepID=A0A9D6YUZ6_UNCSA|nr:NADH-quinone oxidoreductase subunit J [Candidatus Saganbacteria bacterium]